MLEEFIEHGYGLEQLKPYEEFLIECSKKDYSNCYINKHHILPKFMLGSNKKSNLINLSLKDHYTAHLILSESFPVKSPEKIKNISSANRVIQKARYHYRLIHGEHDNEHSSEFWERVNVFMKELMKGENSPNFGRIYTEEERRISSEARKGVQVGEKNGMFGKNHKSESIQKMKDALAGKRTGEKSWRFGKKFGPISQNHKDAISKTHKGKPKSEETKQRMRDSRIRITRLEQNVFYCILDLTETQQFYRICDCGKILYYKNSQNANGAARKNCKCSSCNKIGRESPIKGKTLGPRKFKIKPHNRNLSGENNPNFGKYRTSEWKETHSKLLYELIPRGEHSPSAKKVLDVRSGIEYGCINDAMEKLNLTRRKYVKLVSDNVLKVESSGKNNGNNKQ